MLIEVPRFEAVPTDVTPSLQERLSGVTDILSRVSKLVSEDLEKAVSTAVGQDKDGNQQVSLIFQQFIVESLCVLMAVIGLQVLLRIRGRS